MTAKPDDQLSYQASIIPHHATYATLGLPVLLDNIPMYDILVTI